MLCYTYDPTEKIWRVCLQCGFDPSPWMSNMHGYWGQWWISMKSQNYFFLFWSVLEPTAPRKLWGKRKSLAAGMIVRRCLTNDVHFQHLLLCSDSMTFTSWVGLLWFECSWCSSRLKWKARLKRCHVSVPSWQCATAPGFPDWSWKDAGVSSLWRMALVWFAVEQQVYLAAYRQTPGLCRK